MPKNIQILYNLMASLKKPFGLFALPLQRYQLLELCEAPHISSFSWELFGILVRFVCIFTIGSSVITGVGL
jgi:hypothetical protein